MKILPQTIFSEFKNNILNALYFPSNPLENIKARITATFLLKSDDRDNVAKAKEFIFKTSCSKENDLDFLMHLASQVKYWDLLQICSKYTNVSGSFLEYKLSLTMFDNSKKVLHFHAKFETKDNQSFFISQTAPLIRVTSDPILQKPGILFPEKATAEQKSELDRQIEHAKSVLIETSGAGIAANQCAAIETPYRFTIVGVFYNIPEHASGVERRYPGTKFPQAMIMVNPVITAVSKQTQNFNHACLSVPCSNRCAVVSPMEMSVKYLDPLDGMRFKDVTLAGVDSVVLWHELTHIIGGKTYMDVTFENLSVEDLTQFKQMVLDEIKHRQPIDYSEIPELTVPPFYFSVKVNDIGTTRLESNELLKALTQMTEDTLLGLSNQAEIFLKKKYLNTLKTRVSSNSIFSCEVERWLCEGEESSFLVSNP